VAPYVEDGIIIILANLGEFFSGRELLLDDRVLKEFGYVVWERLGSVDRFRSADNNLA